MQLTAFIKNACPGLVAALLKTGRIMKLLSLFLFAACLQVTANGYSQGISLNLKDAPITTAFTKIQEQTPYRFIYASEEIVSAARVTCKIEHASLEQVLQTCFKDQPLSYSIEERFILVKAKEKNNNSGDSTGLEVRGRITNEKGEPLPGSSITIKNSQLSVPANAQGEFVLKGISRHSVIIISSIGYHPEEVLINDNGYLNISLRLFINSLEETVVKGYYSTSRKLNTGSVSKIAGEELNKQPIANLAAGLEGRMSGVQVIQNTGVPGGGFSIQIRGQNSLRTFRNNNVDGNLPLYIVDGIPFTALSLSSANNSNGIFLGSQGPSSLNNLNIADIESIEVLKDADATAIYGSRGSNGVLLITTKTGKTGKTKIAIDAYTGTGKVASKMQLMNTREFLDMRYKALANDNIPITSPSVTDADLKIWDTTRNTDWQKKLIGNSAQIASAQITLSGGNSNTQFLAGGGYFKESAVFPGDNYDKKTSGHFNLVHSSTDNRFKATLSASYMDDKNSLPPLDLTGAALTLAPDAPALYDSAGNLNWEKNTWTNPLSYTKKRYLSDNQTLITHTVFSYQLFPGLQIKTNLGYTTMNLKENYLIPISSTNPAFHSKATAYFTSGYLNSWIAEPALEYKKQIAKGNLSILAGSSMQEMITGRQTIGATGFTNDALMGNLLNASFLFTVENPYNQYRYSALYGRIGYDWQNKYILNLTGRRDGSSRFGPDKQWANFGAAGAAWIFSEEPAIKRSLPILSFAKLRSSYGITGSDQIGDYGFLDTYSSSSDPYNGVSGLVPTRIPNPDYSWETNRKLEAALELGFINNKYLLTINWYRNQSSNQLVGYDLPLITGFSTVQANFPASVRNTGWEFEIAANIVNDKRLKWITSFNVSIPKNKLVSYSNIASSGYSTLYAVGKSLYIKNVFPYNGVDPATGLYTFSDIKGNLTSAPNYSTDRQFLKEVAQEYYGGLLNEIKYGGFQLTLFLQFVKQTGRNYLNAYGSPAGWALQNRPTYDLDSWQNAGDNKPRQKYTQRSSAAYSAWSNLIYSSATISDASFIRLKNVSLAYNIKPTVLKKLRLESVRLYLQAQNLLTITHYFGLDPETQGLTLPPVKFITGGFQITL